MPKRFFAAALATLAAAVLCHAAPRKFRLSNPALARSIAARGGRLIADYGAFQIVEADPSQLTADEQRRLQPADGLNIIHLNARRLDTRSPQVRAMRRPIGPFPGRRLHLVQFAGPIKPEWRRALAKAGARVVSYIPQNTYLIYGDARALARMQSWASNAVFVQWEGNYSADLKVHPAARSTDAQGRPREIGTAEFTIQMVGDPEANSQTLALINRLKLSPIERESQELGFHNITVALPADKLDQIASQPDVVSIQPYFAPARRDERQDQIVAGNLAGGLPTGPGYLAWLASRGFTQAQFDASGFVVDVSDSGIDNGTTTPGHFALYPSGDSSQPSRVAYSRFERTVNHSGATLRGCDGHGNLNAHIICGYDDAGGPTNNDAQGFSYGLGVCPFVKVGASVIFDNSNPQNDFTSPNYNTLLSDAYNSGARISNNSWGASAGGAYDVDAQTYDALVRDAQASVSGNQQMVVVFVAGNDTNSQTINSPGSAKNVITVGASENVRSLSAAAGGVDAAGDSGCSDDADNAADNAEDMTDFSSRGPCADGRMKPDLVAPGTHITGGVAQTSPPPDPQGGGSAISCFDAEGVCALPGGGSAGSPDNFFPLGQEFFTVSSGTSHAAPAVSGACALLRQYFINHGQPPPSPAMTKAWLINSARYLTGAFAGDNLWSAGQGMGELDLGSAFDDAPRIIRDQVASDKFTATGQARGFTGVVADPSKPFRVTVAWTDAPGSTAGAAYNNDLDLTVTIGGQTYTGNVFNGAFSTTGGLADHKDNVESVFLPAGTTGAFTVTVTAADINSDGVPNEAPALDQDFALVIYNGEATTGPSIAPAGWSLASEDCLPTNGVIDAGETVSVNFGLQNIGTADTTNLVATLLATNGVAGPSGPQAYGALVAGGAAAAQPFSFTAAAQCGDTILATFQLQDGVADLGTVTFPLTLGVFGPVFAQNFDGGAAPALPPGWTSSASGAQKAWILTKSTSSSAPNSAFSPDPASVGVNALVSSPILLPTGPAQLVFQNNYSLESSGGTAFDGGVLEIKIGNGIFTDVLAAGGHFETGGYTGTIATGYDNPLAGRQCWSGNSGGFIQTVVDLPASAGGQTIQLQWRCASDASRSGGGWYIDSVVINSRVCCPDQLPPLPYSPAAATYNGLFSTAGSAQPGSSGALTLKTTATGAYSGTLLMGNGKFPFSGRFDSTGAATNLVPRKNSSPLTVTLQVNGASNERLTGTVSDDATWTAALQAYCSAAAATSLAGQYTLVFASADGGAPGPSGDGYATFKVNPRGAVKLKGALPDGTMISEAGGISPDGRWPFYVSLYGGTGQLMGWLQFDATNVIADVGGEVEWVRGGGATGSAYPAGFDLQMRASGSLFNPAARPALSFTSLILDGSGVALTNPVSISINNQVTGLGSNKLVLKLSGSSGLFKGSVTDPSLGGAVPFSGVVLQKQEYGAGYFRNGPTNGEALLAP